MWKAQAGVQINLKDDQEADDDWETDPDFVNDVTEQEQRWGSTTVQGSGRTAGAINMDQLRRETEEADALKKKKELIEGPNSAFGYGGKFGVQKDRMDQSAVGHDYVGKVEKHASQKDYSTGFGGKYGIQSDRVDKSAVTWDHKEKLQKHASQKDYSSGFGGKYGVQTDRQDKSAMGWDHVEKIEKHESQKDYSKGFGGKFGVQSDRQDKSALGWDHHEAPQKHESQTDHKIGFGGKFGVQTDRMDKSAVTFNEEPSKVGTNYSKVKPDVGSTKPSELKAKFENLNLEECSSQVVKQTSISKSNVQARATVFNTAVSDVQAQIPSERMPKLDQSKIAFLSQSSQSDSTPSSPKITPGQLDQAKISQFVAQTSTENQNVGSNKLKEELEQLKQIQQQKQVDEQNQKTEQIYENYEEINVSTKQDEPVLLECNDPSSEEVAQEDELTSGTGLTAIALYDYQAGADDEISFDPDDVITYVEKIDKGWWRGMCKGSYGLFPSNYVQLQE